MQIYSLKFLYKHFAGALNELPGSKKHLQNVYTKTLDYKFAYGYLLFRCIEFRNLIFSLSQSLWSVIREFKNASSSQCYLLCSMSKLTTFIHYEIIII